MPEEDHAEAHQVVVVQPMMIIFGIISQSNLFIHNKASHMGNQCCEETSKEGSYIIHASKGGKPNKSLLEHHRQAESSFHQQKAFINYPNVQRRKQEATYNPILLARVHDTLQKHKFFKLELSFISPYHRKFNNDIYIGQLDQTRSIPHGLGTMHQEDGSVYVGHFQDGIAHGKGAFVARDGSFYLGSFYHNIAQTQQGDQSHFESDQLKYVGGFKDNKFEGYGVETGSNYRYEGLFQNGARTEGVFSWKGSTGNFQYKGTFNSNNKFHGKGILKDANGVYEGSFHNGRKHGQGQYRTNDGKRYVGKYQYDELQGLVTIYNADNSTYYRGQFMNSLPLRRSVLQ